MSRRGPLGLAIGAATTTPALTLFAIAIVALASFVGAAAPGLLQQVQSESLRYALRATDTVTRDFAADTRGAPLNWDRAFQQLADARDDMDPGLREVLGPARVVVEFDPAEAQTLDPNDARPRSQLYLRYDLEFDSRVTWTSGRAPEATADGIVEFGLTTEAAAAMDWAIDEQRDLPRPGEADQRVQLVGLYEVDDPADPDWTHAPLAVSFTRVQRGLEAPLFSAIAVAAAHDLETPVGLSDFVATTVWYPFDVEAVRADEVRDLIASMRFFTATSVDLAVSVQSFFVDGLQFGSTAPITMTQAVTRIEATSALVALIASGPLAVAIVVLALTARMLALRRRATLRLAEARGASWRLRAGLLTAEGLVIGLVGGVGGGIVGALVGEGRGGVVALVPVLVALTPPVVLPVLGLLVARRRVRADIGAGSGPAARWRVVVELAVVALAGAATVLVLTGALARDDGSPDPLVTVLPLLLAAAGCVVTLRLLPLGLAAIERAGAARRGVIALLGPARARRDPAIRVAPVLAVVVGVAIAVFSVAFSATVDAGIRVAAQAAVGSDLRVTAPFLTQEQLDALDALDGVRATAPVYADQQRDAQLPDGNFTVIVYVIDVEQLREVQNDAETAIDLPDALLDGSGDLVPVLASQDIAARAGDEPLTVEGDEVRIVATAPAQTPLGTSRGWIAVDRSLADRLLPSSFSPATVLVDLEPSADPAAVAEQARQIAGTGSQAATPASAAAVRLEDPALVGLQRTLIAAIGVVAALLALAIGMTLVLGAPARGRLLALLGALGFRRSRELALVVWEVAPAVLVAMPVGAAVGLALPWIIVPALDLTGFVGGSAQPLVRLGGWLPLYVVLGFVAVTIVAVLVAALVARRVTAAGTLRSIDEEG